MRAVDWIDWPTLERFVREVFEGYGVPPGDAEICTDVLLEADRRGIESHGVNRLKPIYLDRIRDGIQSPVTTIEVLRETASTAVVDGHNGMGQVIAKRCMQMAIDKAKKVGCGFVAARGSTHYGIAGYYATMATSAGCVGMTGTNARPSIAPTFGVENMLGTNPLTFGLPTDESFPFVLDCATSIVQRGRIEAYARVGKDTPPGTVVSDEGETLTDSAEILKRLTQGTAALAPLGGVGEDLAGYKGYGYAAVVEILSAALQQGQFLHALTGLREGQRVPFGLGHFFMAMDCEAFMGLESFQKTAGDICRALRASKKAPGQPRIYTAGEKEHLIWQERRDRGVPVNRPVQLELLELQRELGLTHLTLPFAP